MNTKVKGNNKGFSLVELIVVMAIMAILAVTLAPRLSQYVDKARVASDQEAVNTIFTAAKLANMSTDNAATIATLGDHTAANLMLFNVSDDGKTWVRSTLAATTGFQAELVDSFGNFKLKSSSVTDTANISITVTDGKVSVALKYSTTDTNPYTVAE